MNKAGLVDAISEKTGLTQKDVRIVVDATMDVITDTLEGGGKVTLVRFGTFGVMERKTRRGVNPQTKKRIDIPAKKVTKFKAGKGLKEKVG